MERVEKQAAVEWLAYQLNLEPDGWMKDLIEQAKAMEKEQKIKFAEHCLDKALDLDIRTAFSNVEQYYNETFKSE